MLALLSRRKPAQLNQCDIVFNIMTTKKKAGRPPGARNKTPANRRLAARITGTTPLEFLLDIMKDAEQDQSVRIDAAKAAAPYCHARLQSVTVEEKPYEGDPNSITNAQLAGIIARGGGIDAPAEEKGKGKPH
jgi:hypothetical protein